jgi:hypothetical protein
VEPELGYEGGEYQALSSECRPAVSDAKVVNQQEIATPPWKRHAQLANAAPDAIHQVDWERSAVGVAAVERLRCAETRIPVPFPF